jgi:hypothetical protein
VFLHRINRRTDTYFQLDIAATAPVGEKSRK